MLPVTSDGMNPLLALIDVCHFVADVYLCLYYIYIFCGNVGNISTYIFKQTIHCIRLELELRLQHVSFPTVKCLEGVYKLNGNWVYFNLKSLKFNL